MKAKLLVVAMALWPSMPSLVAAQGTASCPGCEIGIYNDARLCRNFGTFGDFAIFADTLYLGVKYDPSSSFDALTGIEFSVHGMPTQGLPLGWTVRDGGTAVGPPTPAAPADTTTGTGGWNVVWPECQPGNRVVVQISMVSFDPFPNNTVIRILHRFPPLDRTFPYPLFTQCDVPYFTKTSVRGGCFVLNPDPALRPGDSVGNPPCLLVDRCFIAVDSATWSGVKALYR